MLRITIPLLFCSLSVDEETYVIMSCGKDDANYETVNYGNAATTLSSEQNNNKKLSPTKSVTPIHRIVTDRWRKPPRLAHSLLSLSLSLSLSISLSDTHTHTYTHRLHQRPLASAKYIWDRYLYFSVFLSLMVWWICNHLFYCILFFCHDNYGSTYNVISLHAGIEFS